MSNLFLTEKNSRERNLSSDVVIKFFLRRGDELLLLVDKPSNNKTIPMVPVNVLPGVSVEDTLSSMCLYDYFKKYLGIEFAADKSSGMEMFVNTQICTLEIIFYGEFLQFTPTRELVNCEYVFHTVDDSIVGGETVIYANTPLNRRCIAKLFPDRLDLAKYTELAEKYDTKHLQIR